jgi:GTP:adenosylcobinamide-phosphate guanylyltransferase
MYAKIKFYFHQMFAHIELLFENYITKYLVPTIDVLNEVKKAVDNPIIDFAATLAGLKVMPEIKAFLDEWIPKAILELQITAQDLKPILDDKGNPLPITTAQYLSVLRDYLASVSPALQEAALAKVAAIVAKAAHGSLTTSQAVAVVGVAYAKLKDEAAALATTKAAA